jgi:glycosyltransferase involved in cell wall biosynthesis
MRLLIASDHFPPFIGGGHRWTELVATGLARRGHSVNVATVWHKGLPRVGVHGEHGVTVHRVRQLRTAITSLVRDPRQRHAPPFPDPVSIRDLRAVIKRVRPDVVMSHGWLSFSVAPALGRSSIPLLASVHDYGYYCANRTLLHRGGPCSGPAPQKCLPCAGAYYGVPKGWLAVAGVGISGRLLARRISAVHSISSFVDEATAAHLLSARAAGDHPVRRFTVTSALLDGEPPPSAEEDRRAREILAELPHGPFILFVGALRPLKGLEVLFAAYEQLDDPPPLVLLGTIERDTPARFPAGATVLTDVPHAAVMAAWAKAMIGVAPSLWPEPLGLVAAEAIWCGTPMIGTVPGGTVDVLGDGAGVLVPQGDIRALAEAMRSLIDAPERRAELSRAALARSASFESEAVLSRYEQMLREVAGAGA